MKIWLVQIGETLPINSGIRQLRTSVIAEKFLSQGHSVLWWASAFDHFKKKWIFPRETEYRVKENFSIYALKGIGYKKNISLSRFIDHRIISWRFKKIASHMSRPDLIIVSMPSHDLAFEAVKFGKKNGIPVFVDIRDGWPDIFLDLLPEGLRKIVRLILFYDFYMVKWTMKEADGLLAMMDTLLKWGLRYAGRTLSFNDRVFYLGYKKLEYSPRNDVANIFLKNSLAGKFVITYIGSFSNYHDPSVLVECARKMSEDNLFFVLAGGGEYFKKVEKKTKGLNNVLLPGWLEEGDITDLLRLSMVGVCPTTKIADFFPNKAFLYLSAGLPVISSFQGDLKEIIKERQIGFYYPPNDVDVLVDCIDKLHKDKEFYVKMSANVRNVFDEMFDADKIYEEYAEHVERIALNAKASV